MTDPTPRSPWPHRWAWLLCLATFPLLWVGGLITTTDAGMAVPDWPGTYGYNLFLYPWTTWMFGPWDLFIEHGHRLLASGVGLLTIAFLIVVWRCDDRRWLRWLAVGALALVILQGVLGGVRVWLNARHLALVHGATGPLFFALTAALVVLTGKQATDEAAPRSTRWRWLLPALVYAQLVLGASLRHVPEDGRFDTFGLHVQTHLIQAGLVTLAVIVTAALAWRRGTRRTLPCLMAVVVAGQLGLGVATWVAKYRLPAWANATLADAAASGDAWAATLRPVTMAASTTGGWAETHTVTAHSATGSLLLALATAHAVRGRRRDGHAAPPKSKTPLLKPLNPRSPA